MFSCAFLYSSHSVLVRRSAISSSDSRERHFLLVYYCPRNLVSKQTYTIDQPLFQSRYTLHNNNKFMCAQLAKAIRGGRVQEKKENCINVYIYTLNEQS